MAHNSSKPQDRNLRPPESEPTLDEKWKSSPSTETTADEGKNAALAEKRTKEENSPPSRKRRDG